MRIHESAENYLETILVLKARNKYVRSVDIANELGFSKPSVSVAMKNLREAGFVTVDEEGCVSLTEKGTVLAQKIYDRHNVIAGFLISIGVDRDTAYEDSCKIEHCISDSTFVKLKEYMDSKETEKDMSV